MLVSLLLGLLTSRAEDLEYELELGGGLGTGFYLGDVNSTPFAHLGGMAALTPDGGAQMMLMYRAFEQVKASLKVYADSAKAEELLKSLNVPGYYVYKKRKAEFAILIHYYLLLSKSPECVFSEK